MVCPQSKKRDRSPSPSKQTTMPSSCQEDEYERAVAFLQEFHGRRVAALHTIDRSLDAITEEFDDLADDFSLALNVDSLRSPLNLLSDNERPRMNRAPKMKKTATFTSLVDLDDSTQECTPEMSHHSGRSASHRPPCRPKSMRKFEVDADDNLVYCITGSPISKRHRGRLGSAA